MESLVTLADKIGCQLIAEGIETATELTSLASMGVHFAQGYFVARPASPKPCPSAEMPLLLETRRSAFNEMKCSIPVRDLAEPAPQIDPETRVKEVKEILDNQPMSGVVVVEDGRPVGLVMSHRLDRKLGSYYVCPYYDAASQVMDRSADRGGPHSVERWPERHGPQRFKISTTSSHRKRFLWRVSVQKMLDTLARSSGNGQGASPLTACPQRGAEKEIQRRGRPTNKSNLRELIISRCSRPVGCNPGTAETLVADVLVWSAAARGPSDFVAMLAATTFVWWPGGRATHLPGRDPVLFPQDRRLYRPMTGPRQCEGKAGTVTPGRFAGQGPGHHRLSGPRDVAVISAARPR
jgi:CBS domain-containing protein